MSTTPTALDTHITTRNAQLVTLLGAGEKSDHYLAVLQGRADAFAAHVATMDVSLAIVQWALQMEQRFGRWVKVHHFIADWITALLIVRYGEEPDGAKTVDGVCWPTGFTTDDVQRATEMLNGNLGNSITLLTTEG
ncbi:MAG TPA: hypothetical protein VE861_03920 [Gemmatimonadaceae bacterium]|nr:hypothetical protein [Gemmatimonadaceae bacterium]